MDVRSEAEFNEKIKDETKSLVVVDFHASWTGGFQDLSKTERELSLAHPHVGFLRVDVDKLKDLASKHNITALPTLEFYKQKEFLTQFSGTDSRKLKLFVEQLGLPSLSYEQARQIAVKLSRQEGLPFPSPSHGLRDPESHNDESSEDTSDREIDSEEEHFLAHLYEHLPKGIDSTQAQAEYLANALSKRRSRLNLMSVSQNARQKIKEEYKPRHAHLYTIDGWKFHPKLHELLSLESQDALKKSLTSPADHLYEIQILTDTTCEELLDELGHIKQWAQEQNVSVQDPASTKCGGINLESFGFEQVFESMVKKFLNPLSKALYPHIGESLDSQHGFAMETTPQHSFGTFSVDDSEITLNICLGKNFQGGQLYFGGVRCSDHQQTAASSAENVLITPKPGFGLLHLGRHRYAFRKVASGYQANLILWSRSKSHRQEVDTNCPPWCGLPK